MPGIDVRLLCVRHGTSGVVEAACWESRVTLSDLQEEDQTAKAIEERMQWKDRPGKTTCGKNVAPDALFSLHCTVMTP